MDLDHRLDPGGLVSEMADRLHLSLLLLSLWSFQVERLLQSPHMPLARSPRPYRSPPPNTLVLDPVIPAYVSLAVVVGKSRLVERQYLSEETTYRLSLDESPPNDSIQKIISSNQENDLIPEVLSTRWTWGKSWSPRLYLLWV